MKRGFTMDFLNTRMCFSKFWEQQKRFWDTKFLFDFFVKSLQFEGGGGSLEKVYILGPFP